MKEAFNLIPGCLTKATRRMELPIPEIRKTPRKAGLGRTGEPRFGHNVRACLLGNQVEILSRQPYYCRVDFSRQVRAGVIIIRWQHQNAMSIYSPQLDEMNEIMHIDRNKRYLRIMSRVTPRLSMQEMRNQ